MKVLIHSHFVFLFSVVRKANISVVEKDRLLISLREISIVCQHLEYRCWETLARLRSYLYIH